jgi:TolB protein
VTATDVIGGAGHGATASASYTIVLRDIVFARGGDIFTTTSALPAAETQLTAGTPNDSEPEWTPDGKIVFSSNRSGNDEIYIMNADGTGVKNLSQNPASDKSPTASANGKIAFASNRGANWDIYTMNLSDGSNVQRLTTNGNDDLLPTWSPTGTEIAFFSARSGQGDIYKISPATPSGKETRLTSGTAGNSLDTEPAWSPSATIAFTTYRHGASNAEIYTMDTNGGSLVRRTNTNNVKEVTPAWSPDSSTLVYARAPSNGTNFDIYTLKLSPVASTALVTSAASDITPDW